MARSIRTTPTPPAIGHHGSGKKAVFAPERENSLFVLPVHGATSFISFSRQGANVFAPFSSPTTKADQGADISGPDQHIRQKTVLLF
jgi:hypothetical protein